MREVTPETAAEYLQEIGRVPTGRAVTARGLGWGVSNVVIRVDIEGEPPMVLKQARERLRTQALWISRLERIWTERAALELLTGILPAGAVPGVLFSDEPNYLFAMSCAPDESVVWKEQLLAGDVQVETARRAGALLGIMHRETMAHPGLSSGPLAQTEVFGELRIEPFYRTIARAHPDLAARIEALTGSMAEIAPACFVHADFSPKNVLVHSQGLTLVDFETAHAGDPAFDVGFVLSHLLLKAARAAPLWEPYVAVADELWNAYKESVSKLLDDSLVRRSLAHAAACALARVDGTSPVDYLDEPRRSGVRAWARSALAAEPSTLEELIKILAQEVRS